MFSKQLFLAISICFFIFNSANAQKFINEDWIYQPYIKSVKLIPNKSARVTTSIIKQQTTISSFNSSEIELLSICSLSNQESAFTLLFDDTRGENKRYRFQLILCNADWTTSNLSDIEYIQGFSEDRIGDPELSLGVSSNYNNYQTTFPNQNIKITKSGNYVMQVFEDNSEKTPILSRRFLVVENLVAVTPKFSPTASPDKTNTHQELDFALETKYFPISNPFQEMKVSVLQNGRWDTEKNKLKSTFHRGTLLEFDYQDSLVFPAGKEFRYFDIRSFNTRRVGVQNIDTDDENDIQIELISDEIKPNKSSLYFNDLNGAFYVDNLDLSFVKASTTNISSNAASTAASVINPDSRLRSEYGNVMFYLKANAAFENADVYIMGKMFDWQCYPENKMIYDEESHYYLAEVPLKQGYYNYCYAVVPQKGKKTPYDLETIDGNWYETENEYTILVYYRPQGGRYDRIIGIGGINSRNTK